MSMGKKLTLDESMFILLSILHVSIKCCFGIGYIVYILFIYLLFLVLNNRISKECFLIYSLFIPNKYLQLLLMLIFLFTSKDLTRNILNRRITVFLLYIVTFGSINCLVYQGSLLSTIFQIGFFYCVLMVICAIKERFDAERIFIAFDKMFFLQCVTVTLQYLITKHIMDTLTGTLISAHYLGIFLIVYMYVLLKYRTGYVSKSGRIMRISLSLIILIAADAKHVWMSFVMILFVTAVLSMLKVKNKVSFAILSMLCLIMVALIVVRMPVVHDLLSRYGLSTYLYNENYNKKYQLFFNAFNAMRSWNGLFGFGVGQFGSQISITMSKGIIYSWRNDLQVYDLAIQPYKDAISGLMTEWYTLYGIPQSSMVLGYPLVSFVGLVAELGVVGLTMFLRILDERFQHCDPTFLIWFFMLAIFDTYLEIPCVSVVLLLGTVLTKRSIKSDKCIYLYEEYR